MSTHHEERVKKLLREALPPVGGEAGLERDLWPQVLRRMDWQAAAPAGIRWLDGALLAGLIGFAILFPTMIPVFLYYL